MSSHVLDLWRSAFGLSRKYVDKVFASNGANERLMINADHWSWRPSPFPTSLQTTIDANLSTCIRLQLTPRGRAVDRERWAMGFKHRAGMPPPPDLDYTAPIEDQDGWSEWTLSELLETFGPIWHTNNERLFEPNFQIVLDKAHAKHQRQ